MVPFRLGDDSELTVTRTAHGWAVHAYRHGSIVGVLTSTNEALSRLVRGQRRSVTSHSLELRAEPKDVHIEVVTATCPIGHVPRRQLSRLLEIGSEGPRAEDDRDDVR